MSSILSSPGKDLSPITLYTILTIMNTILWILVTLLLYGYWSLNRDFNSLMGCFENLVQEVKQFRKQVENATGGETEYWEDSNEEESDLTFPD